MKKFHSKYLARLPEIHNFLKENPGILQSHAAKSLNIPERSFSHLVKKTELSEYFFSFSNRYPEY